MVPVGRFVLLVSESYLISLGRKVLINRKPQASLEVESSSSNGLALGCLTKVETLR